MRLKRAWMPGRFYARVPAFRSYKYNSDKLVYLIFIH